MKDQPFVPTPYPDSWIDHYSQTGVGRIWPFPDKLHVLTMLENPVRARARYKNYWSFAKHVEDSGAILYTCEVQTGGRLFEVTEPGNPRHLQLRAKSQLWRKENALCLLAQRLPDDARCIAWIDADIQFARTDWAQETLQLLQVYDVIQMFSNVQNLGPDHAVVTARNSFMWNYIQNRATPDSPDFTKWTGKANPGYSGVGNGKWNHTGFAWAARRSAWNILGGLPDFCILGSADYHTAAALVGHLHMSLNKDFPQRYVELLEIWAQRADIVRNNPNGGVGYMPGTILHRFHGSTKNRSYNNRWKLLSRTNFNPDYDLKRDHQGLWQLTDRSPELRDGLRAFNVLRDEDSPDITGML